MGELFNYSDVVAEPKAVDIVLSENVSCLLSILFLKIYKLNIDTQSDQAAQENLFGIYIL